MLSRGTSSASPQPRRATSTPSIKPQSIVPTAPSKDDAKNSHQQALTAANLAFERANEREMSKKSPNGQDATSIANNDAGSRLGRRQSVRFTGPAAIPLRTRSITRREALDGRTGHHLHERQLHSHSHNIEASTSSNERTLAALAQPIGEFAESDDASVPSSYRRLRKAKSMFSPGKAPSAVFSDVIPSTKRPFRRQSLQSSDAYREPLRVPDPRLRKSYSFLRGATDRTSTSSRQATNDAAVQLARDQYLRQLEQQRLKEQPSFFGLGNRRRPQKVFRRTVRTSSSNSYGSAIASPLASLEPRKIKDLGHRARSLSQTIKRTIKRVFKRSSDTEDPIPAQQIKATYPHYGDYISTSDDKAQRYPPVPEPDAELLLRVSSRESVTHRAPSYIDRSARPGSIRSAHSDDDESNDKSRVASWMDSTAANTIKVPQTLERKRLSIIKEDGGPHQPSSSARQYEGTSDGYASFRQPLRQCSTGRVSGPIDSNRIFSALQKKIGQNEREAALDESESGTDGSSSHYKARRSARTPRRTSSIRTGAKAKPDSLSRSRGASVPYNMIFNPSAMESFNDNFYRNVSQGTNQEYQQQDFSDLRKGLTQQQIARMSEGGTAPTKRSLHEVKSAFFPSSMRTERNYPSPYRRAMHTSNETEAGSQMHANIRDHPPSEGTSTAATGQLRNDSVTGSDSIYSRSSGGHTPKATRSSTSLAMSESSAEAGTAIIITGHPGESEQSTHPVVIQDGYSSAASSGNWKSFLATQVASLENFGTQQEQKHDVHPIKDSGHRRENAQVDSYEVNVHRPQSPANIPKQPLAIIQDSSNTRKASGHKVSHSLGNRSPLMSIDPALNAGNLRQNHNAPPSRVSEQPRKASNAENERRSLSHICEPSGDLRQQNSHSSFKTQTEQRNSPTTASVRYGPERAERLRRLKSSSGTSLRKRSSQDENRASRHPSSGGKDLDSDSPDTSSNVFQTEAGINRKLVDSFLRGRRSVIRISEESSTDPAFL